MTQSRIISVEELAKHKLDSDCWVAIDGVVYDVTKFLKVHPAGKGVIIGVAGKDVTSEFYTFHKKEVLAKYGDKLRIGVLDVSAMDSHHEKGDFDIYTPFAESAFTRGWHSPYMNASHTRFRMACRQFLKEHISPHVDELNDRGMDPPAEMIEKLGAAGILACRTGLGTMKYVKTMGLKLPGGVSPDEFNYFNERIAIDEVYRLGSGGVSDGLGCGMTIGLLPVIYFGKRDLKARVAPECISGKKRICLAITEPIAGSDVASIHTKAVLNEAKTHYIVNGMKKWITGGYPASYYTTAVRTGGPGHAGLSLMLIEDPRDASEGVITKHKIKTSYSGAAGTSLIIFENVLVPVGNLLGREGDGFKLIMANFNHERWFICCIASAFARDVVAECYRWAIGRMAFGKRLIDQPVIRFKLAEMTAILECTDAWVDSITHQMNTMTPLEQFEKLAAPIALCKFQTTRAGVKLADHAAQILGGRGVTRTGMGRLIESFKNEVKFASILGGSEEIVADLAVRQSVAHCDKLVQHSPEEKVHSRL